MCGGHHIYVATTIHPPTGTASASSNSIFGGLPIVCNKVARWGILQPKMKKMWDEERKKQNTFCCQRE